MDRAASRVACWAAFLAERTEPIPARGFGPGLPGEGVPIFLRIAGERLRIDGWPDLEDIRRGELSARRQGESLVIDWQTPGGKAAVVVAMADAKVGARGTALSAWLAPDTPRHDSRTRNWLWTVLFLLVGLPLLLVALLFGLRHSLVDAVVANIPVAQEIALADELWRMQRPRLSLLTGTSANRFVEEVGARLVATSTTPYVFRFHIADDSTVNAFAMPAGYVVLNRGLIEKAASAEEVAGVLAHEIEHVVQRHSLRATVQTLGFGFVWGLLSGDLGGGIAGEGLRQLAALKFSREQETAADSGGFSRLVAAGIDPRGMARFFDAMTAEPGRLPDFVSTHPSGSERLARLQGLLNSAPLLPRLDYDWAAIQSALAAGSQRP